VIISLRAGSRLFLNGAVIKADRKVNLHLLNDATFLLESHVMQAQDACSPLRQLYFVLQVGLMNPAEEKTSLGAAHAMLQRLMLAFDSDAALAGLAKVRAHLDSECLLDALKTLRGLFAVEDAILNLSPGQPGATAGDSHDRHSSNDGRRRFGGAGGQDNRRRRDGQL
jgi:flagellar biosynthesis repressor protein FlbT